MSVGYDPFSTLQSVPKTPKQRYEVMTEVMPKNGKLSLEMMYQTCGTQINLDYTSEKNFIKKFKLSSFLVPLSVAIFANSPIKENKSTGYFSYRSKAWQHTSRGGLPRIFLEEMDFEKYTDMAINMPLLFILKDSKYVNAAGNTFKDFMKGKIDILKNKNILIGFAASIAISAIAADYFSSQEDYLNTSLTLIVDYTVFFSTFGGLFYLDNRKKYVLENGQTDKSLLKSDLVKIISSLGISEVVYTVARWSLQYYLLLLNYEPYMASIISQMISTVIYMFTINLIIKLTKLFKNDSV